MLRRLLLIIVGSFFLYSCGFDSSIVKRIDLLQQQVNLNSQRITENSTRINNIEQKIEEIKERLAKERAEDNFFAQIPPASAVDNTTTANSNEIIAFNKDNNTKTVNNVNVPDNIDSPDNKSKVSHAENIKVGKKIVVVKKSPLKKAKNLESIVVDKRKQKLNPNKLYKKALSFYFSGKYDKAKVLFEKFLNNFDKSNPLYDNSIFWLAYCNIHENNTVKAINLFKKLINEFPYESLENGGKTDAAIYALIKIYKKQGKVAKITKYKKLLLRRFPGSRYSAYIRKGAKG